ncbi:DUF3159 domain-containing protein [Brachybacterium sp. EF45031]|uniref:DUF3159 domain-containing protein n=1 Tax=Brachybacterium sillae TaxID=2810536 RepID=UPI00217D911A|nr:DUF3159 domain-containing protein [Brachybacterium sillae]MCS6710517.1 DUF3159 domain-containing protein [Brachybacterium sillae]
MSALPPSPSRGHQTDRPEGRGPGRGHGLGAAVEDDRFSVAAAVGGWQGVAESVLPTLIFVVLFLITGTITVPAIAAGAVVLLALIIRAVRREPLGSAIGGLLGVALGAVWALRSGQGTDFYAPGLVINAVTLAILLISVAVRRPLVALVIAVLDPRVADWAEDPEARRTYTRATLVMAGLYALKLAVQLPLYLSGSVAALGTAKLAMGLPLFALVVWIIWMMHRTLLLRRGDRQP